MLRPPARRLLSPRQASPWPASGRSSGHEQSAVSVSWRASCTCRRISTLRCRTRSSRHSKTADAGAALLWALAEPRRLDRETRATIESSDTEVLFSAASIWEIAIKSGLGRSDFAFDAEEIARAALDTGFIELPVRAKAAALVAR